MALSSIKILVADITTVPCDAIVSAANPSLLGSGGVEGAIHKAAGPELLLACKALGGCATGQAKVTASFALRAKWIIHTVGPMWEGGNHNEPILLASCYRSSLQLALEKQCRSIAFPSISTGAYGFPIELAAKIAISTLAERENLGLEIIMCCFSIRDAAVYEEALRTHLTNP